MYMWITIVMIEVGFSVLEKWSR